MYELRYMGDEVLRQICKPIEEFTKEIKELCLTIKNLMVEYNGVGLAAPQLGISLRIFVVGISDQFDEKGNPKLVEPKIYINPNLLKLSEEKVTMSEGCLSIPGLNENIERPLSIDIEAYDEKGKRFIEKNVSGWKARCILHENDHLNGILFIDYLSKDLLDKHKNELKEVEKTYLLSKINKSVDVQEFFRN